MRFSIVGGDVSELFPLPEIEKIAVSQTMIYVANADGQVV
jgi:hypothetical protein